MLLWLVLVIRAWTYKQPIFVNMKTGIANTSCWRGGKDMPCNKHELALKGARRLNSTIVYTDQCECDDKTLEQYNEVASTLNRQDTSQTCPQTWYYNNNEKCVCGSSLSGRVHCNSTLGILGILDCYCMTYDESMEDFIVGACIYNCLNTSKQTHHDVLYHHIPNNKSELNEAMCGPFNRTGQLCGHCKEHFVPLLYSYDLTCIQCSDAHYHLPMYIVVAFLPLTLFLLLVLFCRISATSAKLNAVVGISQMIAIPANVILLIKGFHEHDQYLPAIQTFATIYGIWNLDFFRTVTPNICMNLRTLQVLALDYAIAFYPLLLLVVTYLLIELHSYGCWPIVQLWRPFQRCCRNRWDIRSSIINAFATFLWLSHVKFLTVSFGLLAPIHIFDVHGKKRGLFLYHDGSVPFLGKEHLPYAVLALIVVLLMIVLPILLLILYPMRCFQKCLSHFNLRCRVLHVFMDAFQGCYKDGTDGTCDCRYFAAVCQLLKITLSAGYVVTFSALFYGIGAFILLLYVMLIVIVQPYKQRFSVYNTIDTALYLSLATLYASILCFIISEIESFKFVKLSFILIGLTELVPFCYIFAIILYWVWHQCKMCSHRHYSSLDY